MGNIKIELIITSITTVLLSLPLFPGYMDAKDPSFCLPPNVIKSLIVQCQQIQSWFPDFLLCITPFIIFGVTFAIARYGIGFESGPPKELVRRDALQREEVK